MTPGSLISTPVARLSGRRRKAGLDADALDALYRDHHKQLLIFFARRTMDAESATDLTGETFAVAFRDRRQFRGSTREEAAGWLFGIARHQLSGFYRRGSVERDAMQRLAVERRDLTAEEIERIDELAGLAEMRGHVRRQMQTLEPDDQEILRLRVVEELDYEKIAAELGVTEDAVRARVSRALKRLRQRVENPKDPRLAA